MGWKAGGVGIELGKGNVGEKKYRDRERKRGSSGGQCGRFVKRSLAYWLMEDRFDVQELVKLRMP